MVESWVGASPIFPDELGNGMPWPIPGMRIVIFWEVASPYGEYTSVVTPTCTITRPDGVQVQAAMTEEYAPYRAFVYTPTIGGPEAYYTGTVDYAGGDSTPGGPLDPGSAPFDFHVRDCIGDTGVVTKTCTDGTTITVTECIGGYLEDTGQECEGGFEFPWWLLLLLAIGGTAIIVDYSHNRKRKK